MPTHDGSETWQRIKEALRRDWEQTKHDFSRDKGQAHCQSAGETIQMLLGRRPIPGNDEAADAFLAQLSRRATDSTSSSVSTGWKVNR